MAPGAGLVTRAIAALGFVLSCAASSFAMLALFLRFARARTAVGESLRENAYGIYLVHYAFVSWLQDALLPLSFPALAKCAFVFEGAVGLSWATTAALRRLPALRRIL
jgi:surface polysaccharide O-acyltransferase-like enzyme